MRDFDQLKALARRSGGDAAALNRGACKLCGGLGHLTKQCRNFLDKGSGQAAAAGEAAAAAAGGGGDRQLLTQEDDEAMLLKSDSFDSSDLGSDSDSDREVRRGAGVAGLQYMWRLAIAKKFSGTLEAVQQQQHALIRPTKHVLLACHGLCVVSVRQCHASEHHDLYANGVEWHSTWQLITMTVCTPPSLLLCRRGVAVRSGPAGTRSAAAARNTRRKRAERRRRARRKRSTNGTRTGAAAAGAAAGTRATGGGSAAGAVLLTAGLETGIGSEGEGQADSGCRESSRSPSRS